MLLICSNTHSVEGDAGKDEVPGPNPGSSSTRKLLIYVALAEIRDFFASKSSKMRKPKKLQQLPEPAFSNISDKSGEVITALPGIRV